MPNKKIPEGSNNTKLYFPSLDGLRFFAFFLVFLHHVFQNTSHPNQFVNGLLIIVQKNGWVGVDLFFVLSGFLITILLLEERKKLGSFSLKKFWIRRSLRIWPLYFLALIFGFLIAPLYLHQFNEIKLINEFKTQLIYYLLFLGNWATVFFNYSNFKYISHLWTISIEEQFYLLWPMLLLFINNFKKALIVSVSLILTALLIRFYLSLIGTQHPAIYTNTFARIDTLTFGALLALIYFYKPQLIKILHKFSILPLQIFSLILFSFFLYQFYFFDPYYIKNGVFGYTVIALFMSYLTLSALKINTSFTNFLKFKPFVFLGKISYGLYVWHILAIDLTVQLLFNSPLKSFSPIISFLLTILLGTISYYLFEIKFLKLKKRFSTIESRPI